ncbi:hypothetical protein HK099_005074 [Clydaea vesicula]|uniref:Zn(2)-C6 fungal-type domain-containing protein n=1 Tax=Clydaea vesicula TaxID=447962 RepID=A0AAD5U0V1_9FUNG|nr:hypothetical protein HK099_005074 [Clydaea vesicula]
MESIGFSQPSLIIPDHNAPKFTLEQMEDLLAFTPTTTTQPFNYPVEAYIPLEIQSSIPIPTTSHTSPTMQLNATKPDNFQITNTIKSSKDKRKKVQKACDGCRKAHLSCSESRPCDRCKKRNHLCVDSPIPPSSDISKTVKKTRSSQSLLNSPNGLHRRRSSQDSIKSDTNIDYTQQPNYISSPDRRRSSGGSQKNSLLYGSHDRRGSNNSNASVESLLSILSDIQGSTSDLYSVSGSFDIVTGNEVELDNPINELIHNDLNKLAIRNNCHQELVFQRDLEEIATLRQSQHPQNYSNLNNQMLPSFNSTNVIPRFQNSGNFPLRFQNKRSSLTQFSNNNQFNNLGANYGNNYIISNFNDGNSGINVNSSSHPTVVSSNDLFLNNNFPIQNFNLTNNSSIENSNSLINLFGDIHQFEQT